MMDDKTRDLLLKQFGEDMQRLEDTFRRCNAYVEKKKLTSNFRKIEIGDTVTFSLPPKFTDETNSCS